MVPVFLPPICNPLVEARFMIKKITDTKPIESMKAIHPDHYENYLKKPSFMIISADKHSLNGSFE